MRVIYTDHVIIVFKNNCQHVKNTNKVLTLLRQAEVTLILSKFSKVSNTIEYLDDLLITVQLPAVSKNVNEIKTAFF